MHYLIYYLDKDNVLLSIYEVNIRIITIKINICYYLILIQYNLMTSSY